MEPFPPLPRPAPGHGFKTIRRKMAALPKAEPHPVLQKVTPANPTAFVINLARAADRLSGFQTGMADHQWEVSVFNAIDRRDLIVTESSTNRKVVQHRNHQHIRLEIVPNHAGTMSLGMGQIACALSHMSLWQKIVADDLPHACIFEDDAQIVSPWWGQTWPETADFVFIGDRVMGIVPHHIQSTDTLNTLLASHPYIPLAPGCGTEAYIVTNAGARKALRLMETMYMPVDLQLLSCAHGARLVHHSLLNHKRPAMPELEAWTSAVYHTVHRNEWPSFVNER